VIYDFCFVLYWGTNKMLIIIIRWRHLSVKSIYLIWASIYKKLSKSLTNELCLGHRAMAVFQRGASGPEVRSLMCPRLGTDRADLRQSPPPPLRKRLRHTVNHIRQLLPVCCRLDGKRLGGSGLASDRSNPSRKHVGNSPRSHNVVGCCPSTSSSTTGLCDVRESATCLLDGLGLSVRKSALGLGPVSTV